MDYQEALKYGPYLFDEVIVVNGKERTRYGGAQIPIVDPKGKMGVRMKKDVAGIAALKAGRYVCKEPAKDVKKMLNADGIDAAFVVRLRYYYEPATKSLERKCRSLLDGLCRIWGVPYPEAAPGSTVSGSPSSSETGSSDSSATIDLRKQQRQQPHRL